MRRNRMVAAAAAVAVALAAAGCDGGAKEATPAKGPAPANSPPASTAAIPAALKLAAAPAGAAPVAEAKKQAKEGDKIVLRGRIGGSKDPFVAGLAMFTIADPALPACTDRPGDTCPTPWDYCCETRDTIASSTATIEVDGPDGKALREGLRGWNGLEPLKKVVVVGTVGPRPSPSIFVVRATGIFVE